jgi:hypothetical protein
MIQTAGKHRIWLNFWSKITGNLDEAEDEAEASVLIFMKTLQL